MSDQCGCAAGHEANPNGRHAEADHRYDCSWARGVGPSHEACGGCWGCQAAQAIHYERLNAEAEAGR